MTDLSFSLARHHFIVFGRRKYRRGQPTYSGGGQFYYVLRLVRCLGLTTFFSSSSSDGSGWLEKEAASLVSSSCCLLAVAKESARRTYSQLAVSESPATGAAHPPGYPLFTLSFRTQTNSQPLSALKRKKATWFCFTVTFLCSTHPSRVANEKQPNQPPHRIHTHNLLSTQ